MTDQQPHTPTIEKMRKAFAISHWDVTNEYKEGERLFDEQIAAIEAAAEQRGAIKALREFADAHRMPFVMFSGKDYRVTVSDLLRETARIIEQGNRADQMEGDNDD